ncbi:hypothetical protein FAEPRAM212_01845 [Faecalibacterium prausnitzii M21/2]|uniref:Uncharacterized protein n=1 Tax=Faecalibacterium prausnitzii M21/2 TaxID=411485 RepID=A8SC40_9FIRM|nr:hypothetical protein FAEPRAM212_01845 [Faecalibacterium prausnitzii M21/2]
MSTRKFIKKLTAIEYERCISKRILENFMFRHNSSRFTKFANDNGFCRQCNQ